MAFKPAITPQQIAAQKGIGLAQKAAKYGSTALGGLLALAMSLGKAALAGFLAGAAAGGIGGAILGAKIGAAIGTLIAPGVGTIVGGAIGGIVGGFTGAVVGGAAGLGIGFALGNAATSLTTGTGNFFSSVGTGINSTFASTTTGLSNLAFGALNGASNLLMALPTLSVPPALIAVPVIGTVGGVGVLGVIQTGVITPAMFFSKETDQIEESVPETKYATISKRVTPSRITNEDLTGGREATYTITITAKDQALDGISISNNTTVSPSGSSTFPDFENDKDGNNITLFDIGTLNPNESRTISYIIFIQGDQYRDSTISDTATASFLVSGAANSVSASAAIFVGEGIPTGSCTPASDGNPANGIETSAEELECYIAQVAAGKIEPKSGDDLANVMIRVMRAESGGRQCAVGTAAEIGVFQYIASTWRGGIKNAGGVDSGSGNLEVQRSRTTCWGIPGSDPVAVPPYDPNSLYFNWPLNFGGANLDGGAWDPYAQIDNSAWKMEQGGACIWTTYKNLYPGRC